MGYCSKFACHAEVAPTVVFVAVHIVLCLLIEIDATYCNGHILHHVTFGFYLEVTGTCRHCQLISLNPCTCTELLGNACLHSIGINGNINFILQPKTTP